jgi:hypothetical protein
MELDIDTDTNVDTNVDTNENTIMFKSAYINSSYPLIIIKQNSFFCNENENENENETTQFLKDYEKTLYIEILMTEYEMFYAIIPLYEIKPIFIDSINKFTEYLQKLFPIEIVVKIIKYHIELITPLNIEESQLLNKLPLISIQELLNENENVIDISNNSLYIMDNRKLKFNTKKKYRKEYLKQLVIDGKLSIGSSTHFNNSNIISFLDKEDSEYIKSYFSLTENETWSQEWRGFTNYLI